MVEKLKGKLVILAGIDGSGKSSILQGLNKRGYLVSHWKNLENLPGIHLNFRNPAEEIQQLAGDGRLNFVKGYIESEWKYLIRPFLERGLDVISDGFFIRFYAKESIYRKFPLEKLLKISSLSGRELVIVIDTPPEIALERKRGFRITPYEYFKDPEDFVSFQKKQRGLIFEFMKEFPHEVVKGLLPKDQLLAKVLNILARYSIKQSSK